MSQVRRRQFFVAAAGPAVLSLSALAQQPGKVWRVGILSMRSRYVLSEPNYAAFLKGMRELG